MTVAWRSSLLAAALVLALGCTTFVHKRYGPDEKLLEETRVMRTWGTNDVEWLLGTQTGSIKGDGMSDNLHETLGDAIVEKGLEAAAKGAVKGLVPVPTP